MSESLFQLTALSDFLQLLIWTGQLSDERPASAVIVAPPGAGKTTMLQGLQCEQAMFTGDLTARPLSGMIRNSDKMTHILLGDMLSLFGHKESTVKLTLRLVSQMTGEKIGHDPWTGESIREREIGLITAIPPEDFKKRAIAKHITGGGFASRFLIIRYSYKPSTITAIHNYIAANRYSLQKPTVFFLPDPGKWVVRVPDKVSTAIKDFGQQLKRDPLGFRAHRHLRSLVKAQARRCKRSVVDMNDFYKVQQYCEFFSSDGKAI